MTVAKAQTEIKIGMPSSEVVEVLGSPNMVTTDTERRETWVYDKVSTNIQSSVIMAMDTMSESNLLVLSGIVLKMLELRKYKTKRFTKTFLIS